MLAVVWLCHPLFRFLACFAFTVALCKVGIDFFLHHLLLLLLRTITLADNRVDTFRSHVIKHTL